LIVNPIAILVGGLVGSLVFRFWGHGGAFECKHFLELRQRMMTRVTPTSIGQKTKVKSPREGGFCVFGVFFCGGSSFYVFAKPKNFLSPRESNY
jgi:hypothetical protein